MNVIINNKAVSYSTTGSGKKTLLFLHGWGSNKESFDSIAETLKSTTVISVDLPGFGGSEIPDSAWGVPEYANFVREFLSKINAQVDIIAGHSMGGRVGVYIAAEKVIDLKKLILIGAHGFKESGSVKNKAYKLAAKTGKVVTKPLPRRMQSRLRNKLYSSAGAEDYLQAGELKNIFSKIVDLDLTDTATKVHTPTLIVYGENDDQTPPEFGERYNNLISKSELYIIPGAGHYTHIDAPEKVSNLIKEFI